MFAQAGVNRERLLDALRQMGKKHLKKKSFKDIWSEKNPTRNYCYVVSEFVYYYLAPNGTVPYALVVPGDEGLHRFLKYPEDYDPHIIDLTCDQFSDYSLIDYSKAKVCYFLQTACTGPSKRARILAELMDINPKCWTKPK